MIGVGVSSIDEEKYSLFLENLDANTSNYKFASARNIKGVRKAKNQLLYELRECDEIYLFDDDCYPIKPGWTDFMSRAFSTGQNHFQYNTSEIHGKMTIINGPVPLLVTYNSGGVFLAFTKKVLEVAGYMRPEYQGYGWEHLGYSQRIFRHGLTINPYICPVGLDEFLHAEDYVRPVVKPEQSAEEQMQRKLNHSLFLHEAMDLQPKRVQYAK